LRVSRDSVRSVLAETWAFVENTPIGLMVSFTQSRLDADLRDGELSWDGALELLDVRRIVRFGWPFRNVLVDRVWSFLASHPQPPDIWVARDITLDNTPGLSPVVVAAWDGTGVDVSVFGGHIWTNPGEVAGNGRDDDGNGRVDDIHGVAWSWAGEAESRLHPSELLSPDEYERTRRHAQGLGDLASYRDTPDAHEARQLLATMTEEDRALQAKFMGVWHGTAVGSVLVRSNPALRLVVVRTDFGAYSHPPAPTRAWAELYGAMLSTAVTYLRSAGVRVANLSWGLEPADLEAAFEANAAGGSEAERHALAAEYFGIIREAFRTAIAESPDILFTVGSGNSGRDNVALETIPASFDLPNVLTVGAADRDGIEASFSNRGKVDVLASGVWVETTIPGGSRVPFTGTSLAAPQVANLAAKLLAVDPTLTTAALRRLILETADSTRDERGRTILLLNPRPAFVRLH